MTLPHSSMAMFRRKPSELKSNVFCTKVGGERSNSAGSLKKLPYANAIEFFYCAKCKKNEIKNTRSKKNRSSPINSHL